jgi:hypothetical protein
MPLPKFEGEDFEFPDEKEEKAKVKAEEDFKVEIEDDTPEEDRGRKDAPPTEHPSDE